MDANIIIQYILVGICVSAVICWVLYKLYRLRRQGYKSSCCGCVLSDACNKKDNKKNKKCSPPDVSAKSVDNTIERKPDLI